jgi:hypothetical protein
MIYVEADMFTYVLTALMVSVVIAWWVWRVISRDWERTFRTGCGEQTLTTQHVVPPLRRSARSKGLKPPKLAHGDRLPETPWTID